MWSLELRELLQCDVQSLDIVVDNAHSHVDSATEAADPVPALIPYKSKFKRKTLRRSSTHTNTSVASGYPRSNHSNRTASRGDRWKAEAMTPAVATSASAPTTVYQSPPKTVCHAPIGTSSHYQKLLTNTPPLWQHSNTFRSNELSHDMNSSSSSSLGVLSPSSMLAPRTPRRRPSTDGMSDLLTPPVGANTPSSPCTLSPRRPSRQKSGVIHLHEPSFPSPTTVHKLSPKRRRHRRFGVEESLDTNATTSQMLSDALSLCSVVGSASSHDSTASSGLCSSSEFHTSLSSLDSADRHRPNFYPLSLKRSDHRTGGGGGGYSSDESTVGSVTSTTYSDESE